MEPKVAQSAPDSLDASNSLLIPISFRPVPTGQLEPRSPTPGRKPLAPAQAARGSNAEIEALAVAVAPCLTHRADEGGRSRVGGIPSARRPPFLGWPDTSIYLCSLRAQNSECVPRIRLVQRSPLHSPRRSRSRPRLLTAGFVYRCLTWPLGCSLELIP